jgi:hypothetical protein
VIDALGFLRRHAVLLSASFVLALVVTCLLDPGAGRVFVVEMRTDAPVVAQLYYDIGDGLSEDYSVHLSVPRSRTYQTLRFPLPDRAIVALRFDPTEGPGTFLLRHARVEDAAGTPVRTFAVGDLVGVNEIAAQAPQGQAMRFTTIPNARDPIVQVVVRSKIAAPSPFRFPPLRALGINFASMVLLTTLLARIGRRQGGSRIAEVIRHPRLLLSAVAWRRAVLDLAGRADWAIGLLASAATVFLLFPGFVALRSGPMAADSWALQDPVVSTMTFEPGIRVLRKEVLDHGNLLWSNLRGMGLPILGNDVQASPLFPLTLLFLPVPQPYYWNLLVVTRLTLLGLAAFLLGVRFLALGRVGALVFAFCLVYCLHVLRWMNHPWQSGFLAGLFYLYFALRIVQGSGGLGWRVWTAPRAANVLGLAVSAYGMVTCGFPEAAAMAALLTLFVALPYAVARLSSGHLRKSWGVVLVDLVVANALGVLLGSFQIAALVEFVGLAPAGFRKGLGTRQFPGFEAMKGWLTPLKEGPPPGSLIHLFGLLPAFLFLVGFARRMSVPRRLDWRDGAALLCGGFYLAKNFPVFPAFNDFVGGLPVLRESWFIVYFLPILLWFFAFYAASGMQWWISAPLRPATVAAAAGFLVLVGVSEFLARDIAAVSYWQLVSSGRPYALLLGALLAFLALGLLGPKTRASRVWELSRRAAMLLLVLVELILMHPGRFRPLQAPGDSDDEVGRRIARVAQSHGMAPYDVRVNDSLGVYGSSGIATVDNGAMAILQQRLQALRTHLFVTEWSGYLPLIGPKFPYSWDIVGNNFFLVTSESELTARYGCHTCEALEPVSPASSLYWNPNALPRAYLPARCVVSPGFGESLSYLTRPYQYQPGTVFLETGIQAEGRLCEEQSLPGAAAVSILEDSGSVIRLADVKGPAILVLNDNIYPGWTARDEATGRDLPIRPANVSFRAVVLDEPRPYRIRFAYRPRWLAGALIATLLGGVGVLLCLVRALRRERSYAGQ